MQKRQKTLLALLESFGGELSRTNMQKLLFLYCEATANPVYEFVPYRFGCFSFHAASDQGKLQDKGFLDDSKTWRLIEKKGNYAESMEYAERQALWKLKKRFGSMPQKELVRHVYTSYPYYATRSEIAEEYLSSEEFARVTLSKPKAKGMAISSIGYEGLSLEGYLNKLLRQDVRVVFDVRKNPLSRKFGFSKTALSNALDQMGIKYIHVPILGIVSEKRKELNCKADYDSLFDEYEKTTLKAGDNAVLEMVRIFRKEKRIAVLCYEKLPEQCHRTRVLKALLSNLDKDCPIHTE